MPNATESYRGEPARRQPISVRYTRGSTINPRQFPRAGDSPTEKVTPHSYIPPKQWSTDRQPALVLVLKSATVGLHYWFLANEKYVEPGEGPGPTAALWSDRWSRAADRLHWRDAPKFSEGDARCRQQERQSPPSPTHVKERLR
jgi:hypothetical protein